VCGCVHYYLRSISDQYIKNSKCSYCEFTYCDYHKSLIYNHPEFVDIFHDDNIKNGITLYTFILFQRQTLVISTLRVC
jgi:hypothetical protein